MNALEFSKRVAKAGQEFRDNWMVRNLQCVDVSPDAFEDEMPEEDWWKQFMQFHNLKGVQK